MGEVVVTAPRCQSSVWRLAISELTFGGHLKTRLDRAFAVRRPSGKQTTRRGADALAPGRADRRSWAP
jgi:hypothetical protein